MTATITTTHRLPRPLRGESPPGWQVVRRPEGWLEMNRLWQRKGQVDELAAHADWAGPVKLVERQGYIEQRVEFFPGRIAPASTLDEETAAGFDALFGELIQKGGSLGEQKRETTWTAPPAETLAAWLGQSGYETALDNERNVCLTLKRTGCDGEVRIACGADRLRFVMPLGHWAALEPTAEMAMRRLARDVNARGRLVRIAVRSEGEGRRFEAQTDLTGLPFGSDADSHRERMWRETVRLAAKGLELALRQLGLELPLLADPRNKDLADLLRYAASGE